MKIVVTGGWGLAGCWIVRELRDGSNGKTVHEVTVFSWATEPPDDVQGVKTVHGDVENLGQIYEAFVGADAIVHLAAVSPFHGATESDIFRLNTVGTYNVHEAAYRLGIKRVAYCSSQAILGFDYRTRDFLPEYLPIDEDHPAKPQDAYALSKEAGEAIARSFARKGLETVVLRPNLIVSPEQLEQMTRQGGHKPNRFLLWSYVDARDLAMAFRLALEQPVTNGTVLWIVADDHRLAEPLCDVLPRFMPGIAELARGLTGSIPAISNARAKETLGWRPIHSWRNG